MKIEKMTPKEIKKKFEKLGGAIPPLLDRMDSSLQEEIDLQIMIAFLDGYKIGKKKHRKKDIETIDCQGLHIQSLNEKVRYLTQSLKVQDITIDDLREQIRNQSNIIARFKMPLNPLHEEALKPEEK